MEEQNRKPCCTCSVINRDSPFRGKFSNINDTRKCIKWQESKSMYQLDIQYYLQEEGALYCIIIVVYETITIKVPGHEMHSLPQIGPSASLVIAMS